MILDPTIVDEIIKTRPHKADLDHGIRIQDEHKIHVTGEGYSDALTAIIGRKRAIDYGHRELKEPITKFLTKKVRDELSRWKNTQGTRKTYRFGSDEKASIKFREDLKSVWKDGSIDSFSCWLNDAIYTDFGGFAIVEKPRIVGDTEYRDGIVGDASGKPYIIFKALEDIHCYRLTGRKVEYIITKFSEKEGKITYRVIDDAGDYLYSDINGDYKLVEGSEIPNDLGYVPAIQISDIKWTPLNDYVKTSHIAQTLPLLQDYMTRHAEHVISELLHASPLLAIKGTKCNYQDEDGHTCSSGKIWDTDGNETNCPQCDGVGATVPKTSSEIIVVPELDKDGKTYNPSMIGQYITPPTEILAHQSKELEDLEHRVIYSGTGIKTMAKSQIQTATEIVLTLKPLEDKISSILDNIEEVEKFITDCIGSIMYKDKYEGSEIHYGRKLNVRDENLILDEIEQSKNAGLPVTEIRLLYQELIETRYRNSSADLTRALMLLDLEPIATSSVQEVSDSEYIPVTIKYFKVNFDDYIDRFENEYEPIHLYKSDQEMKTRIKDILTILLKYNEERKSSEERERSQTGDDVQREGLGSDKEA